jgi:hypothetical protein
MKKILAAWTAAVAVLASAGSLAAHHSLSQFDTTTPVRVKGVIVLFERVNPHSILFIDQEIGNGKVRRWAVDGPSYVQLYRMGFDKTALKAGDVVEVCGYVPKEGVESQRTITTVPVNLGLNGKSPQSMSGLRMNGELLVMPDGQQRSWSDYGQHKCFGPDYKDPIFL